MRLLIRVSISFYVFLIMISGLSGLLFLAHFIDLRVYVGFLEFAYNDPQAGIVISVIIAVIMLISLILARVIYGRQERERTISFDNALGRVTISISALEDLVRRMVVLTPQIKEIRPDIVSSKRGLDVSIRLVLGSDVNISELTADLQGLIKRKVQDVVGREERVTIRIHVVKIAMDLFKEHKNNAQVYSEDAIERTLPFPGYKA